MIGVLMLQIGAHAQPIHREMSSDDVKRVRKEITATLGSYPEMFKWWRAESERKIKLTKVAIIPARERVELGFNSPLAQIGIREELVFQWEQMVRDTLSAMTGRNYKDIQVAIYSQGVPIERFIPNAYRQKFPRDAKRTAKPSTIKPLTRRTDRPVFGAGLEMRHIALWPSHGYYYSEQESCWQFQRPALWGVIEDLNSFDYCYSYLIPMLENSGAVVISPRERSVEREEIIVDNDLSHRGSKITQLTGSWSKLRGGFLRRDSLFDENPFTLGTYLSAQTPASVEYKATLPRAGRWTITVSYRSSEKSCSRVIYRVAHRGGTTDIEVNQRVMGSTWVYLGQFDLSTTPTVTVISDGDGIVTADAVRFGGGMGSVVRGGAVSSMPRWAEAARYAMQYAGVPKEIYSIGAIENEQDPKRKKNEPIENDYADDYKSRGDWVNWVVGSQNVPIDLAVGIHTNAGSNDTIFGSMTIHFANAGKINYTNGKSRFAGRDLSDLVLTQIVGDIRALHTPQWTRRSIYDKSYAEISRPDVPSTIVEMFSHQDPVDMSYASQPQFRFDMARAIYKGILRFLSDRYEKKYVVQPLPVRSLAMSLADKTTVRLSWLPTVDRLEQSATPTYYKLYTRTGVDGGFDNGVVVRGATYVDLPIVEDGVVRSYRVTALNDGGESFHSEILSCGFISGSTTVAVIPNQCRPLSPTVPYIHDLGYVGEVYDNNEKSEFVDNDNPGYGASHRTAVAIGRSGETFDNTVAKGVELLRTGVSYLSVGSLK